MEKQKADFIIEQYVKPLYGFAVNKTKNTEQAEELAGNIILQVYAVLRKREDIADINSYIFKIAHNVWTRFCNDNFYKAKPVCIDSMNIPSELFVEESMLQSEEAGALRREIAFLSKQRRAIVMAYYYEGKKLTDIANELDMAVGTVKWHLFECKKELKKGMESVRSIGNLGLNPIKFDSMGHSGSPGTKGDTSYFLAKSLTQNIAFACYFKALSVNEIAQELGVSPIFVEDEVKELCEYGFVDIMQNGKYKTNIVITGHDAGNRFYGEDILKIHEKYAAALVDKYFSKLLEVRKEIEALPLYYSDRDYNFLLWSLIIYAAQKLHFDELDIVKFDEVAILRKDGGCYIAYANIESSDKTGGLWDKSNPYCACGYMNREDGNISGLKLGVYWNGEPINCWQDNAIEDYKLLNHFIMGRLPQNERNLDSYERLINKGYLIKSDGGYTSNIVYIPDLKTKAALDSLLPKMNGDIFEIAKEMDCEIYAQSKIGQPEHMHKVIRLNCQNTISGMHVFAMKNMLDRGLLQLPTETQRKQICNLMFHNV